MVLTELTGAGTRLVHLLYRCARLNAVTTVENCDEHGSQCFHAVSETSRWHDGKGVKV